METDYLIVGQGLCGTLLSYCLIKEGKNVVVIDPLKGLSSSKAAGGIINPVTGKRLVTSWMAEQFHSFAQIFYTSFGQELGSTIVATSDILEFHPTTDASIVFQERQNGYLCSANDADWQPYFRFNYGIGKIAPCMLVDLTVMLDKWREKLIGAGVFLTEEFHSDDCSIGADGIDYKSIKAKKVIFCDGVAAGNSSFFDRLPWSKDKGEALVAAIPGLPRDHMYKQGGVSIVPWRDGLFWIGAAHDWKFNDMEPTDAFRRRVEEQLNYWLKLPYQIVDHLVAQRPANVERKPFVGLHPLLSSVGIFNGMGGKGCSQAPYFAQQFAQHLVHGNPIMPDVDIKRFTRILTR